MFIWQRRSKIVHEISVDNQLTLKEGHYPGLFRAQCNRRILKSERGSLKGKVRGRRDYKRMINAMLLASKMEKGNHEPRNVGSFKEAGKPMEMNSLSTSKKKFSPVNSN